LIYITNWEVKLLYIFIVTSGSYSDKGNEAAFSTKEKAEEYIKYCNDFGSPNVNEYVEEIELDPEIHPIEKRFKFKFKEFYYVEMERDGNIVKIYQHYPSINDIRAPKNKIEYLNFKTNVQSKEKVLHGIINADSRLHAVKILNDKRRQLIAENRWVVNHIDVTT
jgi:hypothetical protein